MKLEKGTFSIFPCKICKGLHPYQQVLLAWLFKHSNDDGICWPSLNILANECGICKNSAITHLKILEKVGYIVREHRKNNNDWASTSYKMIIDVQIGSAGDGQGVVQEMDNPSAGDGQGVVQEMDSNYIHTQLYPITISKTYMSDKSDAPKKRSKIIKDESEIFKDAILHYPKRAGTNNRSNAWKQWQNRIKDGFKGEDMLIATKHYYQELDQLGKIGSEFVMQAQRFYGSNLEFKNYIEKPNEINKNEANKRLNYRDSKQQQRDRLAKRIDEDFKRAWCNTTN